MGRQSVSLLALVLLAAAIYSPLREAPFAFEDVQSLSSPAVWSLPGRGLTAWTWAVIGPDPATAHLVNVALHLVNGLLVFLVASLLTSPLAAVCATGVFLLHPLSSEAVAYVTGRAELLVTACSLAAVWLVLQWTDRAGWWRLVLCVCALTAAALTKEIGAVIAPGLVVLSLLVWRPHRKPTAFVLNGLLMACGVVVGATWWRIASWAVTTNSVHDWPTFALYQLTALWHLLALVVWPVGFSIDHDIVGLSPLWTLAAGLLTVQAIALTCWAWTRAPLVAWALCWLGVVVAPRFLFGTNEFVKEYQLYPGLAGLSVMAGAALAQLIPAGERSTWPSSTSAVR